MNFSGMVNLILQGNNKKQHIWYLPDFYFDFVFVNIALAWRTIYLCKFKILV